MNTNTRQEHNEPKRATSSLGETTILLHSPAGATTGQHLPKISIHSRQKSSTFFSRTTGRSRYINAMFTINILFGSFMSPQSLNL